ncbi:MAG: aminotransferase class V-fold PLP-dependent enzyme [Verrucomicrobium sp.]|jgi:selenocysteine lyase/cysteine desulfurase|nr:aminotransferase class V-fold PLP-dependent enzyme [Verrucomicrobium sp.]
MPLSIPEILADESLRRHEFPVAQRQAFLAHAGVCPLPRRVAEAVRSHAEACTADDQEEALAPGVVGQIRRLAAGLIGASHDEVSLVGPTSLALSQVAAGLQIRRGQNVLIYHDCYPSNVYPWMALADRGIEVRLMNIRELGKVRVVDVQGQVDEDTRLVALASAHYLTGWRINIEAIGRMLRAKGILFCLDAIQTLGAFPTPVANVDILAADAHKWLLGPCAAGILYVRKEVRPQIRPVVHGWHNLQCPDYLTQDDLVFHEGPRRYEAGTHNFLGLHGLKAALELVQEVGVGAIAAELARKRLWLVPRLQAQGYTVLQGDAHPDNAGGITSVHREGTDLKALHQKLREAGVTTSLRILPGGQAVLRLSPHFYNTDEELQRCLDLMP